MAQSAVGKLQAKRLLEVVVKAKVTCSCFQGRFLTLRRPAKMTVEGGWRHRSSEHHGNRKEVLQKVIVALLGVLFSVIIVPAWALGLRWAYV